jgi:ribonuclease P protein component
MLLLARPEESPGPSRFAFAAGKRVGKAVVRNRAKRRMREIVRLRLNDLAPGSDCLFIARPGAAEATYAELEEALTALLTRAGLLAGRTASVPS